MRKLKLLFATISSAVVLSVPLLIVSPVHAALFDRSATQACQGASLSDQPCNQTKATSTINNVLTVALNMLSILVGVAAVIVMIISGLRLILSQGDSNTISSSRNAILYAIVGLVIVALAQIIVHFVLARVSGCPAGQTLVAGVCQ